MKFLTGIVFISVVVSTVISQKTDKYQIASMTQADVFVQADDE
ncbi:MAG: hypothetical protein V3V12_00550 [Gammaproteobacteria bacterium]